MEKGLKIAIMLTAVDKATAIINKAFTSAQRHAASLASAAGAMSSIGDKSMIAGGAITAFFGKTIADARESKMSQDKLIQGFKTMGSTAAQAQKMIAFSGQKEYDWGVTDESINDVMGKLSTFKRAMTDQAMASGVFTRATQAAFDMQAKGFGDAMGNITQLGKALQNPALGAQALAKAGAINKEDMPMIKYIQQTKGIAAAQKFILDAVEKQVKGSAEAMADPMEKLKIATGELSESIGGKLMPRVNRLSQSIEKNKDKILAWVDSHGTLIQRVAISGGAMLAFGGVMKGVSLVTSGVSTAFKVAGGVVQGAQFAKGLMGIGSKALEAGDKLSKMQTSGLAALNTMKTVSKGIGSAFQSMGSAMMQAGKYMLANPIILIIAGIAVAALLIWKYWAPIKAFFINLWAKIKEPVMKFWNWLKPYLLNFTPIGLIIKYWKPLTNMFSNIWDSVKNVFTQTWQWITNLGGKFWDAGANIVKSIWNGIKSMADKPIQAIAAMTKKMREYLPFSPAKAGAFRDLHRVKIVETLVSNMNPRPAMKAMNQLTGSMFNQAQLVPVPARSGGGNNFNFSVNVHLSGKATKEDAQMVAREARQEFDRMMRDYQANKSRVSF